jgi:cysteinyl-tRNA synthetase
VDTFGPTTLVCVFVAVQAEFFADMDALGVRRPDVLTRVVEYMPEIISYVQVRGVRVIMK